MGAEKKKGRPLKRVAAARSKRGTGPMSRTEMMVMEQPVRGPEDWELNTLEDYRKYNKEARANGWRLKFPPHELHEIQKVKVTRLDGQGRNHIKVRLVTMAHGMEIDYKGTIVPGEVYELPTPVIKHLERLAYPEYQQIKNPDGTSQTVETGKLPRFAVSNAY